MDSLPFSLPGAWPVAYDEAAADRLVDRFGSTGEAESALLAQPCVTAMLRCIGGNSPYLAELAVREHNTLSGFVRGGPDAAFSGIMAALRQVAPATARPDMAAALRQAKRQAALVIGLADIGGIWPLENVTGSLSALAEATLRLALAHLLLTAHAARDIRLPDPGRPEFNCGFVALGMGKLGGSGLNYSSDIDLILIYDGLCPVFTAGSAAERIGSFTARLARDLVTLMEARDANGYVFRTDLRLRPDPAATPPAVSMQAALLYYESMGQNWERAAMIKARPVAGDMALGDRFLEAIRPFVWRRGLDFAAVADIAAMKRKIDEAKLQPNGRNLDPVSRIAGYNVKLGQGGIREIEFLVQTLQMVWGGRDPTLRLKPTLTAMRRLADADHLAEKSRLELADCYRFLRQVEHRVQMVNDRQTHSLPERTEDLARIACFMDYPDAEAFATAFLRSADIVRANYRAVFEHVPDMPEARAVGPELDFRGDDPAPGPTVAALIGLGFTDTRRIISAVRQWLTGRVRALRSDRARDLMVTMVPSILVTLGRQPSPDDAFNRFDRFISALPTGVQPMSLFQRNPLLLDRIGAVLGAAPMLAEHLTRYPAALEGLLTAEGIIDIKRLIADRLTGAVRLEEVIAVVRRAVMERDFQISVATLEGRMNADTAGQQRSNLAEAALSALIPAVTADFAARSGKVPGGALAVVAMGKLGGREMMAGSDLDLMFIYDHPPEVTESAGARSLPVSQWFVRLVQACIAALTAPGPEGQMYALDMRLRPSGNKGPLAVSLASFNRYHAGDAWTWERMALTRARVVAGPRAMRSKVRQAIEAAIRNSGSADKVRADAAHMRARMARELRPHGVWDVKQRSGGLIDVEFIAQALQLAHADDPGFHGSQTTRTALKRLGAAGWLCKADAALLIGADRLWRTMQGMLRITVGRVEAAALPAASAEKLLLAAAEAGVRADDADALLREADSIAARVRLLFEQHVGKISE